MPFIEQPRSFTWRKTYINVQGKVMDKTTTDFRIDLRESVFNFVRQQVYTKDTVLVDVNALMYYSIGDVRKAIYEVEDLQGAISNVAQTQLKDVFGGMTFTHALESQEVINSHMRRTFAKVFIKWGINVHRIELQDLRPKSGAFSPGLLLPSRLGSPAVVVHTSHRPGHEEADDCRARAPR